MSYRITQINTLIKKEIGNIMLTEIDLPKGSLCTIIKVDTSKNLSSAKIWISVFPSSFSKKILEKLQKASGYIQSVLYKRLSIRHLPKLRFVIDSTEAEAQDIEKLLDKIKNEGMTSL